MGKNANGQRGLGHCDYIGIPTLVTGIKDKYIKKVQCSLAYSVVFSDDNVITLWGTRSGNFQIHNNDNHHNHRNENIECIKFYSQVSFCLILFDMLK